MGGEGHVFDMIQRAKQNRKMIQDRRDRMKDLVEKMNEKPLTGYPNKLAEGEMEQIERDIHPFHVCFSGNFAISYARGVGNVENAGSVKVL